MAQRNFSHIPLLRREKFVATKVSYFRKKDPKAGAVLVAEGARDGAVE